MCSLLLFDAMLKHLLHSSLNLQRAFADQGTERRLQNKEHMKVRKLTALLISKITFKISKATECGEDRSKIGPEISCIVLPLLELTLRSRFIKVTDNFQLTIIRHNPRNAH